MAGELQKFAGGVPADPSALAKGLANVQENVQGSQGGMPYLRLLKSGRWVYGAENIELEEGSLWAINPYSIQHGFACWGDSELQDEKMVPMNAAPPLKSELPDLGYEWTQQVAFIAQCLDGEDEGQAVLYKTTATGGRQAVKELINALIAQLQNTQEEIVPVVEFKEDSYNHKKHGEIFFPVLEITEWITMDGVADVTEDGEDDSDTAEAEEETAPEPDPEPEQKPRRRRGAKSKDKDAEDEKTPRSSNRRRRRRRSE